MKTRQALIAANGQAALALANQAGEMTGTAGFLTCALLDLDARIGALEAGNPPTAAQTASAIEATAASVPQPVAPAPAPAPAPVAAPVVLPAPDAKSLPVGP